MKVMFFAMLVLCFNACSYPKLMQKDEGKYNKLRMQGDCETKIYDTSVPKHYFDAYYFTNNLNAIEIRDYILAKIHGSQMCITRLFMAMKQQSLLGILTIRHF